MASKRPPTTKAKKTKAALPVALAKRAAALSAAKRARLEKEGRSLIALVKRRRDDAAGAFYDMGVALRRLKDPEMLHALGSPSFAALCEKKIRMSVALCDSLIGVAGNMTREEAIAMGQSRAIAMVSLAEATP